MAGPSRSTIETPASRAGRSHNGRIGLAGEGSEPWLSTTTASVSGTTTPRSRTSIIVNDQNRARRFYTEALGFIIRRDIPANLANWLTIVSPAEPDGTEIALERTFHSALRLYQEALYGEGTPLTALAADNIEDEYARLTKLGVVFQGEPKEMGPTTVATFDDTCGNYIQLFQA